MLSIKRQINTNSYISVGTAREQSRISSYPETFRSNKEVEHNLQNSQFIGTKATQFKESHDHSSFINLGFLNSNRRKVKVSPAPVFQGSKKQGSNRLDPQVFSVFRIGNAHDSKPHANSPTSQDKSENSNAKKLDS